MNRPEYPPNSPQQALAQAVARLPTSARAKYNKLVAQAEDIDAVVRATVERRRLAETRVIAATQRAQSTDPRFASAEQVQAVHEEAETARAAMAEIETSLDAHNQAQARAQQTVAQLRQFLIAQTSGPVRVAGIASSRRKGEGLQDAIVRVRQELSTAQAELAQVKATPPTKIEITQQITDQINALREYAPRWTLDANNKLVIAWPDTPQFSATGTFNAPSGSASKLLAWMFPDQLFALLTDGIDAWPEGLSASERQRRIQELEHRIRNLEHQEEDLIEAAEKQGIEVPRVWRSGWATLSIEPGQAEVLAAAE
jgi:hypothetical protein